jgi:hypothetical protein
MTQTLITACTDDDSFSASSSNLLTFETDTVKLDTTFSKVPTATKSFWVYNHSGDGIRCLNVRLENGNQTGFRVNVDGVYLGQASGYQVQDVEIRKNDSIRVFVELTSVMQQTDKPQKVEDNLVFSLESGVQQKVNLNAFSWDAEFLQDVVVHGDSTIQSTKPIVVYGNLTVDTLATLTIGEGTTLYFHNNAGINVYGRLLCKGTAENNVVLSGDRIDRMLDYLPYDRVSGQWQGIHIYGSSYDNLIEYTDIHSPYSGIECDSADVTKMKLRLVNSTIHNCQGFGFEGRNCKLEILNCQISNTLANCASFVGGDILINNSTFAQFYPFDGERGPALYFDNYYPLKNLTCLNSLITGYADDVLMGSNRNVKDSGTEKEFNYLFDHCVIRTPKVVTDDSIYFKNVIYEDVEDTTRGSWKHFVKIDTDNLVYDFRLDSISTAIGKADPKTALPTDRNALPRDEEPDAGAYEYVKK